MQLRRVLVIAAAVGVGLLPAAASASSGWQITPTPPNPYGTQQGAVSRLASVSCTSASACTAVGEADPASSNCAHGGYGPGYALAERWNGTAWKVQSVPTPADAQSCNGPILAGVKCVSASFCMAVGSYATSTSYYQAAFAERWNGSSWKILPVPNPAGDMGSSLDAVACTAAANCVAVGRTYDAAFNGAALAEHWNGTSWSPMSVSAPAGAELVNISCTAANACTAVGADYTGTNNQSFAERWNGKTWATQPFAIPANTQSMELYGVKCVSASACMAVGSSSGTDYSLLNLAEYWNGSSWQIQPAPTPANTPSELYAISCTALNACTAVGSGPTAENWNGTSWQIQSMPTNSGTNGISCTSATACMAVGQEVTNDVEGVRTVVTVAERRA